MNYRKFLQLVDDSHPMTTDKGHISLICQFAQGSSGDVLELGSHAGISTAAIAMAVNGRRVISVDLCDTVPESQRVSYWHGLGLRNVTPIADTAMRYLSGLPRSRQFGLIFHDAAHGDAVVGEYMLAATLADVLAIHDWEQLSPQHQRSVADLFCVTVTDKDSRGRVLFVGVT